MLACVWLCTCISVRERALSLATRRPFGDSQRIFSAGFDLEILKNFNDDTLTMLRGGFELAARLMAFPAPVVIACTGHAMDMGSFLLCAADYRIGSAGEFKIGANEVAID